MTTQDQITAIVQRLKDMGYVYSKDALGIYFDNGLYRLSVAYHGPGYLMFVNKMTPFSGWMLVRKGDFTLTYLDALTWLFNQAVTI